MCAEEIVLSCLSFEHCATMKDMTIIHEAGGMIHGVQDWIACEYSGYVHSRDKIENGTRLKLLIKIAGLIN